MENMIITNFEKFGFSPELLRGIVKMGFQDPSPVQEAAIEPMLDKKDLLVQAPTGTGKTAAFGLPVLENVDPANRQIQTVVLCPTRELALQTTDVLKKMAAYKQGVRTLALYGGEPIQHQIMALKRGPQIVVATPGRLMDHIRRRTTRLNGVNCIVLDEADQMLDMGFREDIHAILQHVPTERQTVLFSATLSSEIKKIAEQYQSNPQQICIKPTTTNVEKVEQFYCEVRGNAKFPSVVQLLQNKQFELSLIFVATKVMADTLAAQLTEAGHPADAIHGDLRQRQRDQVMRRYREGKVKILVATDVAARGIDVGGIDAVVNYDIPGDPDSYVHRIGRTGRANQSGVAYTLIYPRERGKLQGIIRATKASITPMVLDAKATFPDFPILHQQHKKENPDKQRSDKKPWKSRRPSYRQSMKA
ncbi:DEAD/DEAH box helicase [Faecalispora anaeroviscerum]|uniref:DEAD/DEAH box helicase n=1 Tax=Faecalispora anaeroviscerum TaxID=2991836 RepID=UPI0024BA70F0|nr:DEAD/DEAH box helicase [Faecalispora anaeroviscerum]